MLPSCVLSSQTALRPNFVSPRVAAAHTRGSGWERCIKGIHHISASVMQDKSAESIDVELIRGGPVAEVRKPDDDFMYIRLA